MNASDRQSASAPRIRHSAPDIFIRGANVLDEAGGFVGPMDVVVEHGVVVAVGRNLSPGASQVALDGDGLWLLPGIFDCHVHTGLSSFDTLELLRTPFSRRVLETAGVLRRTLSAGVTFVRDAGIADAGVRDAVTAGHVPGPTMQVSVVAIGSTGRPHGRFLDRARPGMFGGLLDAGLPREAAASRRWPRGDAEGRPSRSSLRSRLDQARCHKRRVGDIRWRVRP